MPRWPRIDAALARAPYDVLSDWHEEHDGNLRIILPDTYGTKGFLENAPDWLAGWTGHPDRQRRSGQRRPKSRSTGGRARGEDPTRKRVIFSDGLDVDKISGTARAVRRPGECVLRLGHVADQRFSRVWCRMTRWRRSQLVCKAVSANGRPTVKLSDNPNKAMGPEDEIARYKRVFGVGARDRKRSLSDDIIPAL